MNNNSTSALTNNSSNRADNDSASTRRSNDKTDSPKREAVDRFSQLIENKGEKAELKTMFANQELGKEKKEHAALATEQAVTGKGALHGQTEEKGTEKFSKDMFATQSNEAAAMMFQAQLMASHPAPVTSGHVQVNPNAFADMIEKHVKQLAATEGVNEKDQKVLLRMSDMTLPGTDFLLTRNEDGSWLLRADVMSRSSYDAITRAAPQLAKRFAEKNLGELEISPHFLG